MNIKNVNWLSGIKKLGFGFILSSAFGLNANAKCLTDSYCKELYIGAGGFYENVNASTANVGSSGGFISLGEYLLFNKKIRYGADLKIGYSGNTISGVALSSLNKNNNALYIESVPKIGVNVTNDNSPLFVSLVLGGDVLIASNENGFGKLMVYLGPEIDGIFAISERLKLTYSFGYGAILGGHVFDGTIAIFKGYNQRIMASLGMRVKISENLNFYVKGLSKYYSLNESRKAENMSLPKSNAWHLGLEAGIVF